MDCEGYFSTSSMADGRYFGFLENKFHRWTSHPQKTHLGTKHHVDQQSGCKVVVTFFLAKM